MNNKLDPSCKLLDFAMCIYSHQKLKKILFAYFAHLSFIITWLNDTDLSPFALWDFHSYQWQNIIKLFYFYLKFYFIFFPNFWCRYIYVCLICKFIKKFCYEFIWNCNVHLHMCLILYKHGILYFLLFDLDFFHVARAVLCTYEIQIKNEKRVMIKKR